MRRIATFYLIFLMASCAAPTESKLTMDQGNANRIIIYQMITRLFGNKVEMNKPYGTIEENGVGKFSDITDLALKEIKNLGITHIWYTGVIEHALLTDYTKYNIPLDDADIVKGRAGSPYSIKDYYDVNPDLADQVDHRMEEFDDLVRRTHANELKVIIDFVPNHVARKYQSDAKPDGIIDFGANDNPNVRFSPSNNFYYLPGETFQPPKDYQPLGRDNSFPTKDGKYHEFPAKATGNDKFTASPSVDDWFEAVKLNYGVDIENERKTYFDPIPDTWLKMKDVLIYWTRKDVDGFRCDMAEMVPVEFWEWVIPRVKEVNPEIIFIAEIYNPSAYRDYISKGKFDYLYDKVQLYDTLRRLINGESSTGDIPIIQESLNGINDKMLHFLENHDEQRIASKYFADDPMKAIPAMVVSATVDNGPVMIFFGQEVGEPGDGAEGFSTDDGRTTHFDYWGVPEHQKWMNGGKFDGGLLDEGQVELRNIYKRILNIAGSSSALTKGANKDLTMYNIQNGNIGKDIYTNLRWHGEEVLLTLVGFNSEAKSISLELPDTVAREVGLSDGSISGIDLLGSKYSIKLINLRTKINIPSYGYFVFKLSK